MKKGYFVEMPAVPGDEEKLKDADGKKRRKEKKNNRKPEAGQKHPLDQVPDEVGYYLNDIGNNGM